jgi:hypothetical protein
VCNRRWTAREAEGGNSAELYRRFALRNDMPS